MEIGNLAERLRTTPVTYERTVRPDSVRTFTSGDPGLAIPLGFIPLEREDALESTPVRVRAFMDETSDLLLNSVQAVFTAYLVPKLAFDRFGKSMDAINRSYMKQQELDGSTIPWVVQEPISSDATYAGTYPFYKAAGLHAGDPSALVNSDYHEAYRKVFEWRCRSRSEALWSAMETAPVAYGDLVPAFFDSPQMAMVKPSFDDAMLDGEIPLTYTGNSNKLTIKSNAALKGADSEAASSEHTQRGPGKSAAGAPPTDADGKFDWTGAVWAELEQEGITVSLANIDLAREMQSWAKVRSSYSGIEDDDLIDLLMAGVSVPTLYQAQPMLLGRSKVPFGMTQRYSTEAASLDVSATRGLAQADMMLRAPATNSGGVIVIQVEIVPEQFFERSKDYHLLSDDNTAHPDRLIDQLDPQAVEIVENSHADVAHTDPTGVFGYAPLNHQFVRRNYNLGGKMYKPDPLQPWTEDRNRIWVSEPVDPTLSVEFYLATDLPQDVFMSTTQDNFEFSLMAQARVSGLTYIGPLLREQVGDYDAIEARVDKSRILGAPVATQDDEQEDETLVIDDETETTSTEENEEISE